MYLFEKYADFSTRTASVKIVYSVLVKRCSLTPDMRRLAVLPHSLRTCCQRSDALL